MDYGPDWPPPRPERARRRARRAQPLARRCATTVATYTVLWAVAAITLAMLQTIYPYGLTLQTIPDRSAAARHH